MIPAIAFAMILGSSSDMPTHIRQFPYGTSYLVINNYPQKVLTFSSATFKRTSKNIQ